MPMPEADYAAQQISETYWKVYKFEAHHGNYETTYEVTKGANGWFCTCRAAYGCKHIQLVLTTINPPKNLF
jgi:SWIM zinc finger